LYGMFNSSGSTSTNAGVVFKMATDGSAYSILHYFSGDDGRPAGVLVQGTDGGLYGTTEGSVFRLNRTGSDYTRLTSLTDACDSDVCFFPYVPLVAGLNGTLYGATQGGGDLGLGSVFALFPPAARPQMLPVLISSSGVTVRFTTLGGSTNEIQRAGTLGSSWQTLTNIVASPDGVAAFIDIIPPQPSAFYRALRK
jgi:hypothetical protein